MEQSDYLTLREIALLQHRSVQVGTPRRTSRCANLRSTKANCYLITYATQFYA